MYTNPRGYVALYCRVCQTARLTADARMRLSSAIQHAPLAYTHLDALNNALHDLCLSDDRLRNLKEHLGPLAEDEQRSEHAPSP